MNSRERVLATLNHQTPDRVPIDLTASTITSITGPAYQNLRGYLGLTSHPDPVISHVHQGTICPAEDLLQRYEVDFRTLYMKKSPRGHVVKDAGNGDFYDESICSGKKWNTTTAPCQRRLLIAPSLIWCRWHGQTRMIRPAWSGCAKKPNSFTTQPITRLSPILCVAVRLSWRLSCVGLRSF